VVVRAGAGRVALCTLRPALAAVTWQLQARLAEGARGDDALRAAARSRVAAQGQGVPVASAGKPQRFERRDRVRAGLGVGSVTRERFCCGEVLVWRMKVWYVRMGFVFYESVVSTLAAVGGQRRRCNSVK
jgi:hypothetical protein